MVKWFLIYNSFNNMVWKKIATSVNSLVLIFVQCVLFVVG